MRAIIEKYHDIGENLIPAIAYGDAVGVPYETGAPLPKGSVTGLEPVNNDYLGEFPAGTWSDDTQLSLAVCLSVLSQKGFDLDHQADMHILALRHSLGEVAMPDWIPAMVSDEKALGWGGSTVESVQRLMKGVEPNVSGQAEGAGNGVLMKLAPLVYWQHLQGVVPQRAAMQLASLTQMTHQAPEATVSSLVHADVLNGLMQLNPRSRLSDRSEMYAVIEQAAERAELHEQQIGADPVTSTHLNTLVDAVRSREVTSEAIVALAPQGGFYAPETLVMAYGSFLRESMYPNSVYRAVELGGDSDSVASIVAAMSVCAYGDVEKPHDFDTLYDAPRLNKISRRLAQVALRFDR